MHAYIAFVEVSGRICIKVVAAPSSLLVCYAICCLDFKPISVQEIPMRDYKN